MDMGIAKLASIALILAVALGLLLLGARRLERFLLYRPDPQRIAPSEVGIPEVRERILIADDGAKLVTWYAPAASDRKTILYFHGNGGHLVNRAERIAFYVGAGYGILMMAYRGYSGSEGIPSERANVEDALAAYRALRADGVAAKDIVVFGESLGSGVAVRVAAEVEVGGVVLDAPYTSIVEVGARAFPFLPVRLLMRDRYETHKHITEVRAPVLIVHGARDEVIPVSMGQKLYQMIGAPKKLLIYPEGRHLFHSKFGSLEAIQTWIAELQLNDARQPQ